MTTDELERDLRSLTEPHPEDESLRLEIRATLADQLHERPTTRRRKRLLVGSAALAAAAVAAAIVALIGTGGPSSANAAILANVVRASSPPANMIVHVKESGTLPDGTQVTAEWWQETNQPHALRLIKGPAGSLTEVATDGTTSSQYDDSTNTIYQHADSAPPTMVDPIETMRAGLSHGTAQVAGAVTIDGRSLYKVELPDGLAAYFDKNDYRPVYIDNPQRGGSVVRTQVITYEELPSTAANEKLLSVSAQHPDARVVEGLAPAPTKQPAPSK
jgi:hypothetical protein